MSLNNLVQYIQTHNEEGGGGAFFRSFLFLQMGNLQVVILSNIYFGLCHVNYIYNNGKERKVIHVHGALILLGKSGNKQVNTVADKWPGGSGESVSRALKRIFRKVAFFADCISAVTQGGQSPNPER